MKLVRNLLLAVVNNFKDAENAKVMAVSTEEDLNKLIEDAKKSKLNPMANSGVIPFVVASDDSSLKIQEQDIIGVLSNVSVITVKSEEIGIMYYVIADVLIEDSYFTLLRHNITATPQGFFVFNSNSVGFGLRGITSMMQNNIEEILQIITFDLVLNAQKQETAPVLDEVPVEIKAEEKSNSDAVIPSKVVEAARIGKKELEQVKELEAKIPVKPIVNKRRVRKLTSENNLLD